MQVNRAVEISVAGKEQATKQRESNKNIKTVNLYP